VSVALKIIRVSSASVVTSVLAAGHWSQGPFPVWSRDSVFSKAPIYVLKPIEPPIQWLSQEIFLKVKDRGLNMTACHSLPPILRMGGAVLLFLSHLPGVWIRCVFCALRHVFCNMGDLKHPNITYDAIPISRGKRILEDCYTGIWNATYTNSEKGLHTKVLIPLTL